MNRDELLVLRRAASLLEQWAEEIRGPCSDERHGDFACEDCPCGAAKCRAHWREVVDAADQLKTIARRA